VELEDKEPSIWNFASTGTTPIPSNTKCFGIHLCHTTEQEPLRKLFVLVVREVKVGEYERVGFGDMDVNMRTVREKGIWKGMSPCAPLPKPKRVWKQFRLR
jgi:hypothetical protein